MTRPWLLLPVKPLAEGKSRLAPVLGIADRQSFSQQMLRHVLAQAVHYAGAAKILVLTRCPSVQAIARAQGCQVLHEQGDGGLNAAVAQGREAALAMQAQDLLVVSCDLPLLATHDLATLADLGRRLAAVVIGTDRAGTGTNALYLPPGAELAFRYGPGSCLLHVAEARDRGQAVEVVRLPGIAFDVDLPLDYCRWRRLHDKAGLSATARGLTRSS